MTAFNKQKEREIHLFHQGGNDHIFDLLGSKGCKQQKKSGVRFCVWAPHALGVSVVGDFNNWTAGVHEMEALGEQGLWSVFVPGVKQGDCYQYEILTPEGQKLQRNDPLAFARKEGCSQYRERPRYPWKDEAWLQRRQLQRHSSSPLNIYELHIGTWKQNEGRPLSYRALADELLPYVQDMGYTHIQLLPPMEHSREEGAGEYDICAYFAPESRYGSPKDLMYLVDRCHQAGIGVLMDWPAGHFPKGEQELERFDGSACYEYEAAAAKDHLFDFRKPEVHSFLLSSALFWIEEYHMDGLRLDGVASLLYRDRSRDGLWSRQEDPAALEWIKRLNSLIQNRHPDVMMIAEEASVWPMVTKPTYAGGLGFRFKWNNGWSHDMLQYMGLDPIYRSYNHDKITFGLMYAFSEDFILPLSHDEFSGGKGTLLQRMPGDLNQKFAGCRAFLGYMMAHPGKKLLFMGSEFGQFLEWSPNQPLDWSLLDFDSHRKLKQYVKDWNHLYLEQAPLWEIDNSWDGFQWLVHDDHSQCVVAFRRSDEEGEELLAVCNFTPLCRENYRIGVAQKKDYEIVLNSDESKYGGSGMPQADCISAEAQPMHGKAYSLCLDLPPLSCLLLKEKQPSSVLDAVLHEESE